MSRVLPRFKHVFGVFASNSVILGKAMYAKALNISPSEVGMGYIAVGAVFTMCDFKGIFNAEIGMYNTSGSFGKIFATISTMIGFAWHCSTWPVGIILFDGKNKAKYINDQKEIDEIKYQTW